VGWYLAFPYGHHDRPRRQPLVHRDGQRRQDGRDDQPGHPRHRRDATPGGTSTSGSIATGPDGNLWFTEGDTSRLGILTPTLNLLATTEPPAFVAPGNRFSLTVPVAYETGLVDAGCNGKVTVALASNPGGATLGGTLTVTAKNGSVSRPPSGHPMSRSACREPVALSLALISPSRADRPIPADSHDNPAMRRP
jgi:hypothetical protein